MVAVMSALLMAVGLISTPLLTTSASAATLSSSDGSTINVTTDGTSGLSAGHTVTINASVTAGGTAMTGINARVCRPGTGAAMFQGDTFDFGFQNTLCAKAAFPGGAGFGLTATPLGTGTGVTSTSYTFTVGKGTANWNQEVTNTPQTLTCDSTTNATPCELVVEIAGTFGTQLYASFPLTYAGTPGAPTAPITASNGDGTTHVTWGPANGNGGTIDSYTVTATRTGGAADLSSPRSTTTVGPVLSADLALNNFTVYDVKVNAHISENIAPDSQTGPDSSVVHNVSPSPAGTAKPTGVPSDGAVDLSWSPPASTSGLGSYQLVASGSGGPFTQCSNGTGTTFHFGGLTNGTPYTFTVTPSYSAACAGPFGLPSPASDPIVPAGAQILQQINVTRPDGALVLTEACDTTNPTPYPVDVNGVPNPVYPTTQAVYSGSCSVNLPVPTFVTQNTPATTAYPAIGEGQFFKTDGEMHQVAVVDTRDTDPGYDVTGKLTSDFSAAGGTKHFSAHQLGWEPVLTDHSAGFVTPDQSYQQLMTVGPVAKPSAAAFGNPAATTGLGTSRSLIQHVAAGSGLGIAHLDAHLHLLIPVWAKGGSYSAILQITAV
jgi:hypothetical protein